MFTFQPQKIATVLALVLVAAFCTLPAHASFDYGTLSGLYVEFHDISESSPTDPTTQLFGTPTIYGNTGILFPNNFQSESSNGINDTTQGLLQMTVAAKDGWAISGIRVTEIGSYTLTGTGTSATSATISGMISAGGQTADLSVSDGGHYELPGATSGIFTATGFLDFSGSNTTSLDFLFDSLLATNSEPGTTSQIQASLITDEVLVEFYTAPVPLPGAFWLFLTGLPLWRLYRHRKVN